MFEAEIKNRVDELNIRTEKSAMVVDQAQRTTKANVSTPQVTSKRTTWSRDSAIKSTRLKLLFRA